jgi:hypothetical protein
VHTGTVGNSNHSLVGTEVTVEQADRRWTKYVDGGNNYWGTTDETELQSWIIDSNDDASICATVLYSPFAGQSVPTENLTWGDVKALYR